jgi:hypothetical protein
MECGNRNTGTATLIVQHQGNVSVGACLIALPQTLLGLDAEMARVCNVPATYL